MSVDCASAREIRERAGKWRRWGKESVQLEGIVEEAPGSTAEDDDENANIIMTGWIDVRLDVLNGGTGLGSKKRKAVVKFSQRQCDGEYMVRIRLWGFERASLYAPVQDLAFWLDESEGVVYMENGQGSGEEGESGDIVFCMQPIHGTEDLAMFRWWAGRVGALY